MAHHPVINAAVMATAGAQPKGHTVFHPGGGHVEVIDTVHTGQAIGAEDVEVGCLCRWWKAFLTTSSKPVSKNHGQRWPVALVHFR